MQGHAGNGNAEEPSFRGFTAWYAEPANANATRTTAGTRSADTASSAAKQKPETAKPFPSSCVGHAENSHKPQNAQQPPHDGHSGKRGRKRRGHGRDGRTPPRGITSASADVPPALTLSGAATLATPATGHAPSRAQHRLAMIKDL